MKTKRRHELQTNELADQLARWIEQIRPYSKTIVGVTVLCAAVVFAVGFVSGSRQRSLAQGWADYNSAVSNRDAGKLQVVAERHPGTQAAVWALQAASQLNLIEGSDKLFQDRAGARTQLQEAEDGYLKAFEQASDELIRQRALYGLAQAHEAQNELSDALDRYEEVTRTWPESPIAKQAQRHAEYLKRPETKEFYKWFFDQQVPAQPPISGTGSSGLQFGDVPKEPNVQMPQLSDLLSEPGSDADDEFPKTDDESELTDGSNDSAEDGDESGAAEDETAGDSEEESAPIEIRTEPATQDE